MRLGTADVLVRAKTDQYNKDLKTAEKRTQQFGKKSTASLKHAETVFKRLTASAASLNTTMAGLGVGIGIASLASTARKAVDAYVVQEQAVLQLEQRLRSTGNAAGWTSEQLQRHAAALQQVTTFGDEATIQMQSLLLTFTKIRGPIFRDSVEIVQDMSVALGQDLKSSAIQVGKALNDPILGVTALRRVGVNFDDQQKELIKTLVKSGDTLGAQKLILAELQTEFGGAARAAREGLGGALTALGNKMGDVLEVSVDLVGGSSGGADGINGLTQALEGLEYALNDANDALDHMSTKIPLLNRRIGTFTIQGQEVGGASLKDSFLDALIPGHSTMRMLQDYGKVRGAQEQQADALRATADSIVSDIWAMPDAATTAEMSDALKKVTDALTYEQEQLGRSATLQRAYNECKKAGVEIDSAEGQKILAKVTAIDQETAAKAAALKVDAAATAAAKAQQAGIDASIARMKEEAETYGKTATQIALYQLRKQGATADELAEAVVIRETIDALEAEAKAREKADAASAALTMEPDYWTNYLDSMETRLLDFDALAGNTLDNLTARFGSFFESAIFDSASLGDAFSTMAQGMARSMVGAIGEMAAQWLVYQVVSAMVGKSAASGGAAALATNAEAASLQAGINAYSSTAAIPIVGPAMAPAAMAAALAATEPMAATVAALSTAAVGMAHDGIDSIPKTGTWILEQGERVTTADTSARLDRTLARIDRGLSAPAAAPAQQAQPAAPVTPQSIRVVNVMDPSVMDSWANSSSGEKTIMNHITRNAGQIRQVLGA